MVTERPEDDRSLPVLGIVSSALLAAALFHMIGDKWFRGWLLDLGSINLPKPVHTTFLFYYTTLGIVCVAGLTIGFAALLGRHGRWSRFKQQIVAIPDRWWMAIAAALAFIIPMFVRLFILDGVRVTDDESAYLFMAQVLGDGQVTVDSHPGRGFFDRFMMVNDGEYYSQYFLGWPALLAPFAWIDLPELANPVYSAVSVVGLFLLVRQCANSSSAKGATALYLASPFAAVMAATMLSHTVTMGWLIWTMWAMMRSFEETPPWWVDPLLAFCFSAAFFTRPTVALGIGGPMLIAWLIHLIRHRDGEAVRAIALFAIPAVTLATLFLAVNYLQTGHPLTTAYEAAYDYRMENLGLGVKDRAVPNMELIPTGNVLVRPVIGLIRFNFASWGWICAFLFMPFALGKQRRWITITWASLGGFLVVHIPMTDTGIDSFGPNHYFELLLPVTLLTVAGVSVVMRWCEQRAGPVSDLVPVRSEVLPAALIAALMYASIVMYVPVRWANLEWIADRIDAPNEAVREAGVERGIVFAHVPFVQCDRPPEGFVLWPPLNPPDFEDDVVWVNHLTLELDKQLSREFYPDHPGYFLKWNDACDPRIIPLDEVDAAQIGPGVLAPAP